MSPLDRDLFSTSVASSLSLFVAVLALPYSCSGHLPPPINMSFIMDLVNSSKSWPFLPPPPFIFPDMFELTRMAGYPCEEYKVLTEDGYVLSLYRITKKPSERSYPVLIMHGLLAASDVWLLNPTNKNLPYMLVDEGYEVWLGNFRCNVYSRQNVRNSPKSKSFWDYSFHEMGVFDLPAMIKKVISVSDSPDLIYLGHSMGTTVFLVMASVVPSMGRKVRTAFLLSPIALQPTYLKSPVTRTLISNADLIYKTGVRLGISEFLPRNMHLVKLIQDSCNPSPLQELCLTVVETIYGKNRNNVAFGYYGYQLSSLVAGTSLKNLRHLSQLFQNGRFEWFDYGVAVNKIRYGSISPPDYKLHMISSPVYLYYSDNDILLSKKSVERLDSVLPQSKIIRVRDPLFTHIDFVFGINVRNVLYDNIVSKVKQLSPINDIPMF